MFGPSPDTIQDTCLCLAFELPYPWHCRVSVGLGTQNPACLGREEGLVTKDWRVFPEPQPSVDVQDFVRFFSDSFPHKTDWCLPLALHSLVIEWRHHPWRNSKPHWTRLSNLLYEPSALSRAGLRPHPEVPSHLSQTVILQCRTVFNFWRGNPFSPYSRHKWKYCIAKPNWFVYSLFGKRLREWQRGERCDRIASIRSVVLWATFLLERINWFQMSWESSSQSIHYF